MRMMMKKNRNNMQIMKIINHPTMKRMSTMTNITTSLVNVNVMKMMMSSTTMHTKHMKKVIMNHTHPFMKRTNHPQMNQTNQHQ